MLTLAKLDSRGKILQENVVAVSNEIYDTVPGESMGKLDTRFDELVAAHPEDTFAIARQVWQIVKRNHEPVSPCGGQG